MTSTPHTTTPDSVDLAGLLDALGEGGLLVEVQYQHDQIRGILVDGKPVARQALVEWFEYFDVPRGVLWPDEDQ
jgi:hypothetical protein